LLPQKKNQMKFHQKISYISLLLVFSTQIHAQAPDGYYNAANGKKDETLKTALFNIIRAHTQLEYYTSSTYFLTTDWNPEGYFWDMYSNIHRSSFSGLNREHSLPKSWFGISSGQENSIPAGSDLHNLYPSDATANSAKLNYPIGEVTGTLDYTNGVIKVGTSTTYSPQYTSSVFEPADEYKGDFARDYMYMVTCYEDFASRWQSTGTMSMLLGGTYPVFRPNAVALLLKWHREDPVSTKEVNRNNAVYSFQHNRNPFIDHPELAEFIWGKYIGSPWDMNGSIPEADIPLTVHPNPANSKLTVKVNKPTESTYYIKDLNGIILKTGKFAADGTLSVNELRNDMYILVVYSPTTRKVTKFVVQH
jgi:endonuclease I